MARAAASTRRKTEPQSESLLTWADNTELVGLVFSEYLYIALRIYILLFYLLRSFLRHTEKDTALFILGILQIPAIAIFILIGLKLSLAQLGTGKIIN